ncbi:competence protein ComEA-like protein with helix-hairpin-helix repeat region [Desulfosporosinus orientis DSM 765]|uniref:Competence protein ComEA-like protein with helix-hairpin-helix repeat region n=1 Tax=Desulfosporosinus orientis (strain ATCC 19365 / DSM 765 / NCIMB 8382 / VKM B-1628 / Singapore I) TaxID=768706 RepID=G7WJJ2_DESOD|nr:helix-hairpin-helix domain-containing protein [Desulfosporosinus orientis]AET70429.1 competence protein ComEA-like protein with helix-hairpin-helix repeat region [Desulfosporosinus orientis DSM 765]
MERKLRYAWWVVLGGLLVLAIWKFILPHQSSAYLQKTDANREIVVYVTGAVKKSGLVHLAPDARLDDALKQVQLLAEADIDSMNPAQKLKDGQKINVPRKALQVPADSVNESSMGTESAGQGVKSSSIPVGSSITTEGKININTAGAAELDKLSGVGPALAERIIQYRIENGPFAKPEDIQNVSGIGPKTFEKMASQVTVGP